MLSWFTPFEGWFADAIDLTLDDRAIPTRARWPSGATGRRGFLLAGAGQQSQADADLTLVYDLPTPAATN